MFIRECGRDFDLLTRIWGSVFRAYAESENYRPTGNNKAQSDDATTGTTGILNPNAKRKNTVKEVPLSLPTTVFLHHLSLLSAALITLRTDVILSTRSENDLLMLLMNYEFEGMEGKVRGRGDKSKDNAEVSSKGK